MVRQSRQAQYQVIPGHLLNIPEQPAADGLDMRCTPDPVRPAGDRNARSEEDGALRRVGACVPPLA